MGTVGGRRRNLRGPRSVDSGGWLERRIGTPGTASLSFLAFIGGLQGIDLPLLPENDGNSLPYRRNVKPMVSMFGGDGPSPREGCACFGFVDRGDKHRGAARLASLDLDAI